MHEAVGALILVAFVPMLVEARLAKRHDDLLRARGAREPARDVYRAMQVAYPGSFLAMLVEAWISPPAFSGVLLSGGVVFLLAKTLKYWAMATLGERWTFRVLVPPASPLIQDGPYRLLRHPNYLAVVGELVGFALMTHARVSGPLVSLLFAGLILMRIRVEERALGLRGVDV